MKKVGEVGMVNGPIVQGSGASEAKIAEQVFVGEQKLIGEIVKFEEEVLTVQVYESTSGLKPGAPIYGSGFPLSVELGPGILTQVYDGIQRPLERIQKECGAFIKSGIALGALDKQKKWAFKPYAKKGDQVGGGHILGTVQETQLIEHRVMMPPDISGEIVSIAGDGSYTVDETIAVVRTDAGERQIAMMQKWPIRIPRPYKYRRFPDTPLITGQRVIDTLFPVAKGGTAAIPGPFGSGKTVVQHQLAKWCDADIIIYIGCGERGNEMTDVLKEFPHLTDPKSGLPLMERTVLIANTSNMPVSAREASIYTGMTIAEYFRDMGYNVAVMADSTSRWAEALRELSGRLEEMPAESGFPAYLSSKLAAFYERAGYVDTLNGKTCSLTIVGAVSPPGGDLTEPVTQYTKGLVGTFWALSKELADSRHYPAIGWIKSFSAYSDYIGKWWEQNVDKEWVKNRQLMMWIMQEDDKYQKIAKLVGPETLPDDQRFVMAVASLVKNGFLLQSAMDPIDTYSLPRKQVKLMNAIVKFYAIGKELVEMAVPVRSITALPCYAELQRLKIEVANDEDEKIDRFVEKMTAEMRTLKEQYAKTPAGAKR
ncbi:MAG TPA: V-type ATP synthase subunit A [bacterium]|nr:V-type ATP synthase subunit A [bacterium]